MANLNLAQVQDMMLRKRRRDKGDPYLEERFALSDTDRAGMHGLLDGQALAGVNIVDEYEDPNRIGQYTRWYGNPNTGRRGRDEMTIRSDVTGTDFQDTLAHEVGHRGHYLSGLLGTQAGPPRAPVRPFVRGVPQLGIENRTGWVDQADPYIEQERMYTPDKSDRWHHVLYGMEGDKPVLSGGGRGEIDTDVLKSDIEVANRLARNVPKGEPTSLLSTDASVSDKLAAQEGISEGITMDDLRHHGSQIKSKAGDLMTATKDLFRSGGKDNIIHDEPEARPTTLKQAQSQGKAHFWHNGKKKLAVTADQLAKFKKSDLYNSGSKKSTLSQWANIAQSEGGMKKLFKTDKQVAAKVKETKDQKQFLDDYMQTYYTGKKKNDPKFREDIKARLKGTVPDDHKKTVANAISSAVKIFGTDKLASGGRMDEATMKKMLQDLGQIESGYTTRIAGGGRPERGFWQVLPSTATDALKNAGAYFGPTFNKTFAGRPWVKSGQSAYESLKNMSQKDISKLLESDDALGAAFSAVQVLRTFKKKKKGGS